MIKQLKLPCQALLFVLLVVTGATIQAAGVDVYLVYAGADKKLQKRIRATLPGDLAIKSYNASLLMMADYSGKQKAIAKLSSAKLVVLINKQSMELLGNPRFPNALMVTGDSSQEIDKIKAALGP
ncbi:MAG: hypothetical protein COA42_14525 [Alteromonadaceae bacterium]|nr:MAG: hypothetical protein COA42_14525 [Alteromonadaceae bacterium]